MCHLQVACNSRRSAQITGVACELVWGSSGNASYEVRRSILVETARQLGETICLF